MVCFDYSHIIYVLIRKDWEEARNQNNTDGVVGNSKQFPFLM